MKIITNNKIYVQYIDLAHLMQMIEGTNIKVPSKVINLIFGDIFICDDSNKYKLMEFEDKETINFFKNIDYIINYDDVKGLSFDEYMVLVKKTYDKMVSLNEKYQSMPEKGQEKLRKRIIKEFSLLEYKLESYKHILWFIEGHIDMELPEGYNYPKKEKTFSKTLKRPKKIKR